MLLSELAYETLSIETVTIYENAVRSAITIELTSDIYSGLDTETIHSMLFESTEYGNRYAVVINGLSYAANYITIEDLNAI